MIGMQISMFLQALFGGPSSQPSPAVTEYSLFGFNFNEIGTGPAGLAVMLMIIVVQIIIIGLCTYYCCCHCNQFGCCKGRKAGKAPKQIPGWRHCFFMKRQEDPILPIMMQHTNTYEPVYSGSIKHVKADSQVYEDLDKADNKEMTEPQIKFNIPFRPKIL